MQKIEDNNITKTKILTFTKQQKIVLNYSKQNHALIVR